MAGDHLNDSAVLVVDDNPVNLKLLRLVLSLDGFRVEAATTAEEALEVMRQRTPVAVVADIEMPGMNGLEFARIVRATPEWEGVGLVAVSAHATKLDAQRALSAGYAGLIPKPIDTRTVSRRIRDLLAGTRPAASPPEDVSK